VETAAKPILEEPMLQKPEPPPALVTALAELTKGDSPGLLAVITEHAEAGWPEAQTALGLALLNGQTIAHDAKKAVEYFRKAAEQDDPFAQYFLGQAYQQGSGVKADPIQAMAWFILAASHGHAKAVAERDNRLSALSSSDRHSAFIRVGNLGPKMFAGWSHDPKNQTAVWLPSWYRTGSYSLQVDVPAVDGYAQGQGKVMLKASLPGDSDRVFEGYFSRGYYFGDREREGDFQFLPTNDFLYRLPGSEDQAYRNVAFWLRVDFGVNFAANPCYVATNRKPDLVTVVPEDFTVLDDEAPKAVMGEAWKIFLKFCPKNFYAELTVVPPAFSFGKNRFGHRIFVPQLATGNFYGKKEETLTVGNFVNHAKRAHEEEQRKLAKEREQEERQQKKRQAAAAAKTRGIPDIRGLHLGMTLAELYAHLENEIAELKPRWDPGQALPPFRQFEQSIRLTDGARLTAHFTSPVNGSVLYAIVYEQDLRAGPERAKLVADLEAKYGKPDDKGTGGIWWDYQLISRVNEGLGAFMKVHYRIDRQTNKVEYLRLIVNDAGFGSYDERAAYAAEQQAKQKTYEASKSDTPKF
jgi:TPR repeat protein